MGKRRELLDELDGLEFGNPRIPTLQKKINEIEEWMITKGYIKSKTNWNNQNGDSELYPWHTNYLNFKDIHMVGALNDTGMNINTDGTPHLCKYCE